MTGPLISVIIPIYNAEKYLRHAVDSVINQTYSNLEIILINDNSSDSSLSICESYNDSRIKIISNTQSLGAAGARNKALDIFTGEYVAFVDADDYVHPEFIEQLYKALVDDNADISCCSFVRTFKNNDQFVFPSSEATNKTVMSGINAALNMVDYKSMFYVVFWNKLYKKCIWDTLRLPTGKRAEDFYTSYSFLSQASKVVVIDSALYYYYQQKKSVMHVFDDFSIYMEEALDGFEIFLDEHISDQDKHKKYSDLALIFRCDTVVEDYWKACKKKDKARVDETRARALVLIHEMEKRLIPLRIKFKLFSSSQFLYKIGRRLIDIKESVDITLNRDKAGTIFTPSSSQDS